jgi:hypothetical protein
MIPLGIYRTERVSFAGLDPSYGEDDNMANEDEDAMNTDRDGESGPGKGINHPDDGFESILRKKKKLRKGMN